MTVYKYMTVLAKEQRKLGFEQAEKEVYIPRIKRLMVNQPFFA